MGSIGRPLTTQLVSLGHDITVISSSPERAKEIEAIGATPAIGMLQDVDFLKSVFKDADTVYTMVPPANYFDHELDLLEYFKTLGESFTKALKETSVDHVVNLSSIGAHLKEGNGILQGTYHVEQSLNGLPENVSVVHIRPVEIFYNLFQFVHLVKKEGIIGSNLTEDTLNVWVSIEDIVEVTVRELVEKTPGRSVRYVASEEVHYTELASVLGRAIDRPDLKWVPITDEQARDRLIGIGMQPKIAKDMAEMYAAIRTGLLYEHYRQYPPKEFGKVKLKDFAEDFAKAFKNV